MKLGKPQIIGLSVVGALVLGTIAVVSVMQLGKPPSGPKKTGLPDPGAEIRKSYAEGKAGGDAEKKETPEKETASAEPAPKETAPLAGGESSPPVAAMYSPLEQASKTTTGEDAASGDAGLLPSGSSFIPKKKEVEQELPPVVPTDNTGGRVITNAPPPALPPAPPPIPIIPTPPLVDTNIPPPAVVPTQIKIVPKRYLFNNQLESALKTGKYFAGGKKGPNYNLSTFSPRGEDIQIAFMQNVAGNSFEVPVSVGVWGPFYFQGHRLLETGDKILGQAAAGKNRDRLLVNLTQIIFKSGKSLPINAMALDLDGTVGVKGYVVGDRLLQILAPTLFQAVNSFSETFQKYGQEAVTLQLPTAGGTNAVAAQPTTSGPPLNNDLQTKGIEAGKTIFDQISQILLEETEENKPYVLVPAGTIAKARLMAPLDVSGADYGK